MAQVIDKEELKRKIVDVVKGLNMGCFATIKDGKPWVRYVMVTGEDNLDLYFTAGRQSRKIEQIKGNPSCHILLGGDPKDITKSWVQVAGKAEFVEDMNIKKKLWMDYHAMMFKGPEDPSYMVIRVKPEIIELWGGGKFEPDIYEVR